MDRMIGLLLLLPLCLNTKSATAFCSSINSIATRSAHRAQAHVDILNEVTSSLTSRSPFIESRIFIDDNVQYSSDLISFTGADKYTQMQQQWYERLLPALAQSECCIVRSSAVSDTQLLIRWNVSYVAESTVGLVKVFSSLPGVRVRYFDILNKEGVRSSFSWASLLKTALRLVSTGELLLPQAVIVGSSEYTFAYTSPSSVTPFVLIKQKDSLNLALSLRRGALKNRKLTLDLLEFADAWRPPFVGFDEWNKVVADRLDTKAVPGMGQFEVDGLGGSQQEDLQTVLSNLATITLPLLAVLILFSKYVLDVDVLPGPEDFSDPTYFE